MKIFIDFDDVLFNTAQFKVDFMKIFLTNKVTEDQFKNAYQEARQSSQGIDGYNFDQHIEIISKLEGVNSQKLKQAIDGFLESTEKYIFSDVNEFLEKYKQSEHELFLVSFGSTDFQMKKIEASGIRKYFKDVRIGEISKDVEIKELLEQYGESEKMWFIDDRIEQIEEVKTELPDIQTIFMKRAEGRYKDSPNQYCDFVVEQLKEVETFLDGGGEVYREINVFK